MSFSSRYLSSFSLCLETASTSQSRGTEDPTTIGDDFFEIMKPLLRYYWLAHPTVIHCCPVLSILGLPLDPKERGSDQAYLICPLVYILMYLYCLWLARSSGGGQSTGHLQVLTNLIGTFPSTLPLSGKQTLSKVSSYSPTPSFNNRLQTPDPRQFIDRTTIPYPKDNSKITRTRYPDNPQAKTPLTTVK